MAPRSPIRAVSVLLPVAELCASPPGSLNQPGHHDSPRAWPTPRSSPASPRNGLIVDPGGYWPLSARLNSGRSGERCRLPIRVDVDPAERTGWGRTPGCSPWRAPHRSPGRGPRSRHARRRGPPPPCAAAPTSIVRNRFLPGTGSWRSSTRRIRPWALVSTR